MEGGGGRGARRSLLSRLRTTNSRLEGRSIAHRPQEKVGGGVREGRWRPRTQGGREMDVRWRASSRSSTRTCRSVCSVQCAEQES